MPKEVVKAINEYLCARSAYLKCEQPKGRHANRLRYAKKKLERFHEHECVKGLNVIFN